MRAANKPPRIGFSSRRIDTQRAATYKPSSNKYGKIPMAPTNAKTTLTIELTTSRSQIENRQPCDRVRPRVFHLGKLSALKVSVPSGGRR